MSSFEAWMIVALCVTMFACTFVLFVGIGRVAWRNQRDRDALVRENQDLAAANERLSQRLESISLRPAGESDIAHRFERALSRAPIAHVGRPLCTEVDPNAPLSESER